MEVFKIGKPVNGPKGARRFMLISLKSNLAFLAMPKTGSTAIEAAIGPMCEIRFEGHPRVKHMNARRFERHMRPYLSGIGHGEIETFCLMREPIDWLSSWWRYRQRPQINGEPQSTKNMTFSQFARRYMEGDAKVSTIGSQARFVTDGSGVPIVHRLFRYEDFAAVEALLRSRFPKLPPLERVNVSPAASPDLTEAQRAALKAHLAPEYAIYQSIPVTPETAV